MLLVSIFKAVTKKFFLTDTNMKDIKQTSVMRSIDKFQHEINLGGVNVFDVGYPVLQGMGLIHACAILESRSLRDFLQTCHFSS